MQLQSSILDFLRDLRANNTREWFAANKDRYLVQKAAFEDFVTAFLFELGEIDERLRGLEAKSCIFRIHRDTRFSHNKDPYKTNMGASFSPNGKKIQSPGYYLHCEPETIFFGGGIYMPEKDALAAIRKEIGEFGDDVQAILDHPDFKSFYGAPSGNVLEQELRLKKPPKGFDASHKHVELLKLTSFVATRSFSDKQALSKNFLAELRHGAEILKPFNDMLEFAIKGEKN